MQGGDRLRIMYESKSWATGCCRSTRPGLKDSCGKDEVAHAVDTDTCDGNG